MRSGKAKVEVTGRPMSSRIRVGTCGFAESHARTFQDFDLVEIQQTFYQPPRPRTARGWREQAPRDFLFTLKAWQLITHEPKSPTYRRLREPLSPRQLQQAGGFRWNAVTHMAWERTLEIALALQAQVVLFQLPRSFQPNAANLERLRRFFTEAPREGLRFAFEPRGDAWTDELLRPLLRDLRLIHAVDPFLRRPVGRGLRYFRLHGRPAYHYHYQYRDAELAELRNRLSRAWPNLVLFNNDRMVEDARRFRVLVGSRSDLRDGYILELGETRGERDR